MKALHLSPASASSPSFALISVLALVSLAALTATAFLASARLERQATMPLTQTTILEMALDAGAECAKEIIDTPLRHFNHVTTYWRGTNPADWTNELGYLLNGSARKIKTKDRTSTLINYACCFSTATFTNLGTNASELIVMTNDIKSQGTFPSEMSAFMFNQTNFAKGQSTNIPLLGDIPIPTNGPNRFTSPPVGWVYIKQDVRVKPGQTNTTNVPVARFAFFVQDLSGMIDAERMGGETNRSTGTKPAEISLTNLTGTALTNSANASNFTSTNNRVKYLSPGMLVLSNGGGGLNTNDLRYITTGLRHWTNAYERIPIGLGYANSWSNKCNLSSNANLNVSTISATITSNLPGFTNRAGGFCLSNEGGATNTAAYAGTAYVQTLAANIIDYIDPDSDPTTDGGAISTNLIRPVYRGVDSYPFVNEIAKKYVLIDATNSGNTGLDVVVETTDFIELWNLCNQTSSAASMVFLSQHAQTGNIVVSFTNKTAGTKKERTNPFSFINPTQTTALPNGITSNKLAIPPLEPNAYYILACQSVTNKFFVPTNFPPEIVRSNAGKPLVSFKPANDVTNSHYFVSWNGIYCDAPLGGISRNSMSLSMQETNYRANLPSFIYSLPSGGNANPSVGDPRATIYISRPLAANVYVTNPTGNATFGARNERKGTVSSSDIYYEVNPSTWPDGGHKSPSGNWPTNMNQVPTSFTPIYTNLPPGRILNRPLTNIVELGGVFDPIQWADTNLGNSLGQWTNLTTNATATNQFCGGTTLRIGRAEHPLFSWTNLTGATVATPNMMMASAALIDLFCTTNQFDESGMINLNTAPAPVLRALAGGVYLRSDPGLLPGGINFPIPPPMVEAFAQGVMRFRAKYPFHSPSQLPFIGTDPAWPNTNTWPTNAVFGNTNTISLVTNSANTLTSTSLGITAWNDQATEEWFSKIFKLSTTYSRNFRVYVIAQRATNQGGTNIGVGPVVRKYYNVFTRINTDAQTDEPAATFSTRPTLEAPY